MKKIIIAVFFTAAFTPLVVQADSGWYFGAGAGSLRTNIDDNSIHVTNATASSVSKDETSTAYKLFAGFQFNRNFAIEGGWMDLGRVSATRTVTAPFNGTATGKLKISGFNLDLVGTLPINDSFSALARAGALNSRVTNSRSATGAIVVVGAPEVTETTTQFHYGLGLQYDFSKQWGIRGEWERSKVSWFNNGKSDIDLFSVNAVFKF